MTPRLQTRLACFWAAAALYRQSLWQHHQAGGRSQERLAVGSSPMSLLARRGRSLPLRQLAALRLAAAAGLDACGSVPPPPPPPGGVPPAAGAAACLWRYDSPLLRHLSSVASEEVRLAAG